MHDLCKIYNIAKAEKENKIPKTINGKIVDINERNMACPNVFDIYVHTRVIHEHIAAINMNFSAKI